MRSIKAFLLFTVAGIALVSCGDTALEQGLLGAGAGAGAAVITGGNTTTGAIIGGVANVAYCQQNPSKCN
jgi:hypothetical protein